MNEFKCFALKGGTAINLFIHDMPRLSVDIDLTYLPIENRDVFLQNNERMFLMQLKSGNPDWSLLPIYGIENLPGTQWKPQNINKIPEEKKKEQLNKLKQVLAV